MKKALSLFLSVILFVGIAMPFKVKAATSSSTAGIVNVSSGKLNVRSGNSTSKSVVASLPKGIYVTLISKSGSWWKVEYGDNKYGYCHADYITPASCTAAKVSTKSGNLNVRSGAGTSYSKKGSLPKGKTVLILSTSNGWSKILYNGIKTGYVSSKYLSTYLNYSAVSLSVPNFKQTDSRWSNVYIGSSGKTIGKIGCATTAVAMMESYRTGTTLYPDAMSKKLSYSSSGNVYWPSYYSVVTSSSDYLRGIYNKLKSGKPVLLGAKNASGGQHWIVVTGFKGGNSLSASKFTVNDPGSNTRTTLQAFLNIYPNFYKYFYY